MISELDILFHDLLIETSQSFDEATIISKINVLQNAEIAESYHDYYNARSSVYSAKIEGEEIDFDSYYKHKFLKVAYLPDYTKRVDDLNTAYHFIDDKPMNERNILDAHRILSNNLLPEKSRGTYRNNHMMVLNTEDQIEYVACEYWKINDEMAKFYADLSNLLAASLSTVESFYFAAIIHLVFVKIHPFNDGNGRTARLLEKWFLLCKLGTKAASIPLEKNYYTNRDQYYKNLKVLGNDYISLDYSKAKSFLHMTIKAL